MCSFTCATYSTPNYLSFLQANGKAWKMDMAGANITTFDDVNATSGGSIKNISSGIGAKANMSYTCKSLETITVNSSSFTATLHLSNLHVQPFDLGKDGTYGESEWPFCLILMVRYFLHLVSFVCCSRVVKLSETELIGLLLLFVFLFDEMAVAARNKASKLIKTRRQVRTRTSFLPILIRGVYDPSCFVFRFPTCTSDN